MTVSPTWQVLPWNGHQAAVSLTFDDGDPSQLDVAIPELARRHLRGTFFLISGKLTRVEDWKRACDEGQEIGNHSVSHKRSKDLAPGEAEQQVSEAKGMLEDLFKKPLLTFAYPFTDINPALRRSAQTHHLLSRGGLGEYYLRSKSDPDWDYLPSQVAYSLTSSGTYKGWADQAYSNGCWTIPQFHAFEGTASGWQPLPPKTFMDFLDYIKEREHEIWIAPMGEVGAYWRAQKTVEAARIKTEGNKTILTWDNPPLLPNGLFLKVKLEGPNLRLFQKGKTLQALSGSIYPISVDDLELTIEMI